MSEMSQEKLLQIAAAAEKLVRCKGRYHSEQNYRALAALFGVTTPDLPPLESDLMRERAEPVSAESYPDDSDLSFAIDLNDDSEDFQTAQWLKELRRRRAAQPATVSAGWIACSERMPEVGDIVLTADNGCVNVGEMEHSGANYHYFTSVVSGRELPATHWMPLPAAPGKQPLSVETLANVLGNAPLAPSDSQGRQREKDAAIPLATDEDHWYLVSWCSPGGRFGCTEVSFDNPWVLGSMRGVQEIVAEANDLDSRTVVILSAFPIATAPGKEG